MSSVLMLKPLALYIIMTLFRELINLPLVRLGMYSRMVNLIRQDVLTNKASLLTNITSTARVTFLLR